MWTRNSGQSGRCSRVLVSICGAFLEVVGSGLVSGLGAFLSKLLELGLPEHGDLARGDHAQEFFELVGGLLGQRVALGERTQQEDGAFELGVVLGHAWGHGGGARGGLA